MPSPPVRTAKSSSRSSKRSERAGAGLPHAAPDPTAIAVGEIGSPHGLRGGLRFHAYQPGAPSLVPDGAVLLERDGVWCAATVRHVAPHGRAMTIAFDGVADRDAAAALTGMRLLLRAHDLPRAGDDEFYHHELHGFAVVTDDGHTIGAIESTFPTGLNDVWVVRDGAREHLIPIIADVVREIDRAGRRVVIHAMPGLLE